MWFKPTLQRPSVCPFCLPFSVLRRNGIGVLLGVCGGLLLVLHGRLGFPFCCRFRRSGVCGRCHLCRLGCGIAGGLACSGLCWVSGLRLIFLLGLLNLNTAIRDFKFLKDHGQLEPYEGKKTFKQLFYDNLDWVSGVLMLVYVFSIGSLGFLLPSIVYMFLQILLYTTMGKRNYLVAILSSVLIPCAVYFLFRNYFFLMLPKGILG